MDDADSNGPASFDWLFNGWRGVLVGLFAASTCLLASALAFDQVRLAGMLGAPARAQIGLNSARITGRPGWERITRVMPGGAAAAAHLTSGMLIHFDHAYEASADYLTGHKIGLIAMRDGTARAQHVTLEAQSASHDPQASLATYFGYTIVFAACLSVLLGTFAIVRGWGSPSALTFGLGMLSYIIISTPPTWATSRLLADSYLWLSAVPRTAIVGLLILPAMLYAERIGRPGVRWAVAFWLLGVTMLASSLLSAWCITIDATYPWVGDGELPAVVCNTLCLVLAPYWGWRGWREAIGPDRSRFAALFAISVCMLAINIASISLALSGTMHDSQWALFTQMILSNVVAPLVLAYAVLRHRIVDPGFALNRTVVFGTFSAILLGSFGLIEWGVEHLLPEAWVKASAWIDAGAAVVVYLAFHRVHDSVEQRVELVFFRQWQANEDAMRRFVGSAAHFEDTRALARGFAEELARFGGDARVALYRRNDGVLDRIAGNWNSAPRHFRDDDPAFALMRAERAPLDLGETQTDLPGVLALPMLDHGVLAGLVLLDLKGNGALWRPDEVALLGWATHEVGLALAALHAGLIDTENRLLKAQLARLTGIIGDRLDRVGA